MRNEPIDITVWVQPASDKFSLYVDEIDIVNGHFHEQFRLRNIPIPYQGEDHTVARNAETVTVNLVVYASLIFLISKLLESFLKDAGSDLYKYVKSVFMKDEDTTKLDSEEQGLSDILAFFTSRNESLSYNMQQKFVIASQLNDQNVFIILHVRTDDFEKIPEYQKLREKHYKQLRAMAKDPDRFYKYRNIARAYQDELKPLAQQIILQKLASLAQNWGDIAKNIEKFEIGKKGGPGESPSGFHVIEERHQFTSDTTRWVIQPYDAHRDPGGVWPR